MLTVVFVLCVSSAFADNVRIDGGHNAREGEFPAEVALWGNNGYFCSGSAISAQWIVTAAHCVDNTRPFNVVFNMYDLSHHSGREFSFGVAKIIKHPNYTRGAGTYPNNIALVKLTGHAPQNNIITMATSGDFTGQTCTVSGWGRTSGGAMATILQETSAPVISNNQCSRVWGDIASVQPTNVCMFDGKTSACAGDSGGPLICNGQLVGVTAWGGKSCDGSKPTVFSRITEYKNWLINTMRTQ